jgi:tetratricopeptide (TPR) repeat protein
MPASFINTIDPNTVSGSPEEREARARPLREQASAALERGELALAMLHASDALMLAPTAQPSLQLVDAIAGKSSDASSLVPLSVSIALTACRARVLALHGDLAWAIALVRHVVTAAPSLECVVWIRDWLTPEAIHSLGLDELKGALVMLVKVWSSLPPKLPADDARRSNVQATAEVFARVRAQFPAEAPLYSAEILLRRRLGEPSVTLAVARDAVAHFPGDWGVLVSAANAERDALRPDEALAYARRAMELLPHDGSPLHDAAWAYVEAERPSAALALFQELLADFPEYPLNPDTRTLLARLTAQG